MTITKKQFVPGKGAIYYFSGTGNTAFVAREFQENYKKAKIDVDIFSLDKQETVSSQSKYDFLMLGFPVYAFYPPEVVIDFVKKLPVVKEKPVILFSTGGASAGASFNVLEQILKKKNYDVISNFFYVVPSNDSFLFNKNTQTKEQIDLIINSTQERVKQDFDILIAGKSQFKKANVFLSIISQIAKFVFFKILHKNNRRWYWERDACNYCGLCEKVCPTKNITVKKEKGKVIWGNNCMFCTRCYNFCPQKAIHFKSLKKTKNYRRYDRLKDEIL
jgi:formate hydrogenlyase subunit 6/NADH:ubiquinone oxidoreductase subunit I/flavodoxin